MSRTMVRELLVAVVLAAPLLAGAKGVALTAMGKFIMPCDRAGATDAVYACALSKAVEAGTVRATVVQACRDDLGQAPVAKPNQEIWHCTGLRQFGPQMSDDEWYRETSRDCEARSRRPGHRYAGQHNPCIVDAIIEQRRVPDAVVRECRSQPGIEKSHRLLNCLYADLKRKKDAPASHAAGGAPAGAKNRENTAGGNAGLPSSWTERVKGPKKPDPAAQQVDAAQYPQERVRENLHKRCENTSGPLVYECACLVREGDRHLAQGRLQRQAIANGEFDWTPCIDRARSADKFVASNFTPSAEQAMRNAGVDVEAYKACQHRAIARDLPRESLTSWDYVRSGIKQLCLQNRK